MPKKTKPKGMTLVHSMIVGIASKKLVHDSEEWSWDLVWSNDRGASKSFSSGTSGPFPTAAKAEASLKDAINANAEKYMNMLGDAWSYSGTIVVFGRKKPTTF